MNMLKQLFGITAPTVPQPASPPPDATSTLQEELRDYSGYVRQAALERCAALGRTDLLPDVVMRLNDWVSAVRHAARATMQCLMPLASPSALLQILPAVLQLRDKSRSNHADWLIQFEQQLISLLSVRDFLDGLRGNDAKIARSCFYMLHHHALIEPAHIIRIALATRSDTVLATQAFQLCRAVVPSSQTDLYMAALASPFGRIRSSALLALTRAPGAADLRTLAQACLLDVQSSVRYLAIHYLKTQDIDARAIYHAVLADAASITQAMRVSLLALGSKHQGHSGHDLAVIGRFTEAPLPSVRLAAFSAWFKLAPRDKDAIALQAMVNVFPGVQKFGMQLVQRHGAFIPYATLQTLLEASGNHALLLSYAALDKWHWLSTIARLASLELPAGSGKLELRAQLMLWTTRSNRYATRPQAQERAFLAKPATQAILHELLADDHGEARQLLDFELASHDLHG